MKYIIRIVCISLLCTYTIVEAKIDLSQLRFGGAGVLPVVRLRDKGGQDTDYIILGRIASGPDKGLYEDWGGSRDQNETHPAVTAAREFVEESLADKAIGKNTRDIKRYISLKRNNTLRVIIQETPSTTQGQTTHFVMYVTRFCPKVGLDLVHNFGTARAQQVLPAHSREKDAIAIAMIKNVKDAIQHSKKGDQEVRFSAKVYEGPGQKGVIKTIELKPWFAKRARAWLWRKPKDTDMNNRIQLFS